MSEITMRRRLAAHGLKRGHSAFYQVFEFRNDAREGFVVLHYGKNNVMSGSYEPCSGGQVKLNIGSLTLESAVAMKQPGYTFAPVDARRLSGAEAYGWIKKQLPADLRAAAETALFGGLVAAPDTDDEREIPTPAPKRETVKSDESTPDFYGDW